MIKKDIAQVLVDSKVLTEEQAQQARKQASKKGESLESYLIDNKLATDVDLAKAFATFAGIKYLEKITDKIVDVGLLGKIPLKFLRDNNVIPVMIDGQPVIVTANPLHFQAVDQLNLLLGGNFSTAVSTPKIIIDAINRYYPLEGAKEMIEGLEEEEKALDEAVDFENIEEKDILTMASEAPIIKLVNHILYQAVKRHASDIHIEPFEKEIIVRYRIDGVMYNVMTPPKRIQGALVSRIKIMADLNIAEKRMPQDGRIQIKVADQAIDIRVSVLPTSFGERIVMRLLYKSRSLASIKDLGMSERDYKVLIENIHKPNGIIYITGPTGSGKTTTLYSILTELNKPEVNIITVEDPVEYQMTGIGQVQVQDKIGMTFAAALRSILRQDPDIIMIGETRDQETAQIAIQSALTGHLVLSTLHTNSAPATITRLLDMGIEPYLIASSVELAIAQRLVRKLCDYCKKPYKPSVELLKSIGLTEQEASKITFYEPVGCEECGFSGYKGRLPIFEVMVMTEGIARLTMERADTAVIRKQAIKDGMTLLIQDVIRRIKEGLTTIEEVLSVATIENEVVE